MIPFWFHCQRGQCIGRDRSSSSKAGLCVLLLVGGRRISIEFSNLLIHRHPWWFRSIWFNDYCWSIVVFNYIHINVLYITHICIYMHLHHCKKICCFILFIPSLICYQVKSKFYLTMSMCANVFKVCRVQLLEFGLIVRFLSEVRTHLETHLPRCSRCNDCSCDSLPLACHNERSRAIPRSGLRFLPDKFIS